VKKIIVEVCIEYGTFYCTFWPVDSTEFRSFMLSQRYQCLPKLISSVAKEMLPGFYTLVV
jgi:hypothetical protein